MSISMENLEASVSEIPENSIDSIESLLGSLETIELRHIINAKKMKKEKFSILSEVNEDKKPVPLPKLFTVLSPYKLQIILDYECMCKYLYEYSGTEQVIKNFADIRNFIYSVHTTEPLQIIEIDIIIEGDFNMIMDQSKFEILFKLLKLPKVRLIAHIDNFLWGLETTYLVCKYCHEINIYKDISGFCLANMGSSYSWVEPIKDAFREQVRIMLNVIADLGLLTQEEVEETFEHKNTIFIENEKLISRKITELPIA